VDFESYLSRRGFSGDPFASTNADNEIHLAQYFVPPPYCERVLGIPTEPEPSIVFAPRGSGKSAQRKTIEDLAQSKNYLCVAYINFFRASVPQTLDNHLAEISKLITLAVLTAFEDEPYDVNLLTPHQQEVLKYAATRYLSGLNQQEFSVAMGAVKSLGDKARDFMEKHGAVVAAGIQILLKKVGLDDIAVPTELRGTTQGDSSSATYVFGQLLEIAAVLNWNSVYILIDKVDEAEGVNGDAAAAFGVIEALLMSLPTLEIPFVAFKFFLWDKLEQPFDDNDGRADRVEVSHLDWTVDDLSKMLAERLSWFSSRSITSFNDLMSSDTQLDVHLLLSHLSAGSPRDMIRLAQEILKEHTRSIGAPVEIAESTVISAIRIFSVQASKLRYKKHYQDLVRIAEPTFTSSKLANDVFRIKVDAVRPKVEAWKQLGGVVQVGEQPQAKGRPAYVYAISDVRLIVAAAPAAEVLLALGNYCFVCSGCHRLVITSSSFTHCAKCGAKVSMTDPSLLELCTRP
jgi:hypothetical protein